MEDRAGGFKPVPDEILLAELRHELDNLRKELAVARDQIARLERMVDQDALLPVLNRRGFVRALERAIAYVDRYQARAALIYIDLDDFKAINDRFGHGTGDELLLRVAQILSQNVRRSDMVARLGGDEFAILLWNSDEKNTADKAQQLGRLITEIQLDLPCGEHADLGASSGYTTLNGKDTSEGALARADDGMYLHKKRRRR